MAVTGTLPPPPVEQVRCNYGRFLAAATVGNVIDAGIAYTRAYTACNAER